MESGCGSAAARGREPVAAVPVPRMAPVYTEVLRALDVLEGDQVVLTVTAVGDPMPTFSWCRGGTCVDTDDEYSITWDCAAGQSELVIVQALAEDSGEFECVAMNAAGEARTAAELTVRPEPEEDGFEITDEELSDSLELESGRVTFQQSEARRSGVTFERTEGSGELFVVSAEEEEKEETSFKVQGDVSVTGAEVAVTGEFVGEDFNVTTAGTTEVFTLGAEEISAEVSVGEDFSVTTAGKTEVFTLGAEEMSAEVSVGEDFSVTTAGMTEVFTLGAEEVPAEVSVGEDFSVTTAGTTEVFTLGAEEMSAEVSVGEDFSVTTAGTTEVFTLGAEEMSAEVSVGEDFSVTTAGTTEVFTLGAEEMSAEVSVGEDFSVTTAGTKEVFTLGAEEVSAEVSVGEDFSVTTAGTTEVFSLGAEEMSADADISGEFVMEFDASGEKRLSLVSQEFVISGTSEVTRKTVVSETTVTTESGVSEEFAFHLDTSEGEFTAAEFGVSEAGGVVTDEVTFGLVTEVDAEAASADAEVSEQFVMEFEGGRKRLSLVSQGIGEAITGHASVETSVDVSSAVSEVITLTDSQTEMGSMDDALTDVTLILPASSREASVGFSEERSIFVKFLEPVTPVVSREHQVAMLSCRVAGEPPPTVVWYKDGAVLSASDRVRIRHDWETHEATLAIGDVAMTDAGNYTAEASNGSATARSTANLVVVRK